MINKNDYITFKISILYILKITGVNTLKRKNSVKFNNYYNYILYRFSTKNIETVLFTTFGGKVFDRFKSPTGTVSENFLNNVSSRSYGTFKIINEIDAVKMFLSFRV